MKKMTIIGITGGIGSGKSTVSSYLEEKGYRIIDADKITRDILINHRGIIEIIGKTFGHDLIDERGRLNRRKLADRAFSSPENKALLEKITHGEIISRIHQEISQAEKDKVKIVFLDVILLFETGLDSICDETWVVDAPLDIRVARVMGRDGFVTEEVKKRIDGQMSGEEMKARATKIIYNSSSIEDLETQVNLLLQGLISRLTLREDKR